MKIHLSRAVCAALFAAVSLTAAEPKPGQTGLDPGRLAEVSKRMKAFVDDGTISGAVTLIARHGQVASLEAVGLADLTGNQPMRTDHLFWIASMTKPVTALAVLMLQDGGKLNIEDPVEKYLPEFKGQWLVESRANDTLTLKRPARPITLRDLLTHTSGMGDVPTPRTDCSLAELAMAYSQQPLRFPPGSKWEYSNPGINTLGRLVEVASGQQFADFLEQRIFKPLGMTDTTFWPTPAQAKRIAKAYKPKTGGGLEETEVFFLKGGVSNRARTAFPAGGLYSTAGDMGRFYQMTLNGGMLDGKRVISKESLALMTRTQTAEIKTGFVDGMSWGFGFQVVKEPLGVTSMLSPGTYGHGGAYATQSWADPKNDMVFVLMIQRAGFPNGDNSPVRRAFQEAAVAAIQD